VLFAFGNALAVWCGQASRTEEGHANPPRAARTAVMLFWLSGNLLPVDGGYARSVRIRDRARVPDLLLEKDGAVSFHGDQGARAM